MIIKDRSFYDQFEAVKLGITHDDLALGMFYAGMLRQMWVVMVDHIPPGVDAAVCFKGTQAVLLIAPEFFKQSWADQVMTLGHEILHLILKHPIIYKQEWNKYKVRFLTAQGSTGDVDVMNIGADMVVNGYYPSGKVPSSWVTVSWIGAPLGRSAIEYAAMVLAQAQPGRRKRGSGGGGSANPFPDDEDLDDADVDEPPAPPPSGEPATVQVDEEGHVTVTGGDLSDDARSLLRQIVQAQVDEAGFNPDTMVPNNPHQTWLNGHEDIGKQDYDPDVVTEVIDQMIQQAATQVPASMRGNLPGTLQKVIEKAGQQSVLAWNSLLRRFNASVGTSLLVPTMVKRNRITGKRPGNRLKPKWKLAIVLDGSGSVYGHWWTQFVTEVHHAWKAGAEVWIVKHDSHIFVPPYKYDGKNLNFDRTYGGTNHTEVIEFLNKNRFDGAIALTDGDTWINHPIKPKCRFAWVVTPDGVDPRDGRRNCDFGSFIRINKPAAAA